VYVIHGVYAIIEVVRRLYKIAKEENYACFIDLTPLNSRRFPVRYILVVFFVSTHSTPKINNLERVV
jgi:hypothetical protein